MYRYLAVLILVLALASVGFYAMLNDLFPSLGDWAIAIGALFGPAILVLLFRWLMKGLR